MFSGLKLYGGIAIVLLVISLGGMFFWMDSRITSLTEENAVLREAVEEQNQIIDDIVDQTNRMVDNLRELESETAEIEQRSIERNRRLNQILRDAPSSESSETERQLNENLRNLFEDIENITGR